MFMGCSKIKELELSSFDTTMAKDGVKCSNNSGLSATMKDMFTGMSSLEKITLSETFSFDGDGTTTLETNHALLPTPNGGYWYGADGTAYTPENIPDETAGTYYSTQQ
jgi:surface protein